MELYDFFRGASGFALIVAGLSLIVRPKSHILDGAFSKLFIATGFLFSLSALDTVLILPIDVSNLILLVAIGFISIASYQIVSFCFGTPLETMDKRTMVLPTLVWSGILLLVPFIDYIFGLEPMYYSIEEGIHFSFFHFLVSILMYIWPIFLLFWGGFKAPWSIGDLLVDFPANRSLLRSIVVAAILLIIIAIANFIENTTLYMLGHSLLQAGLLCIYLIFQSAPGWLTDLRTDIGRGHDHNISLGLSEAEIIGSRLEKIIREGDLIKDPSLDLKKLANKIGLPGYRLSWYFNNYLNSTFPEWLNKQRIAFVCLKLREPGCGTILDIALEAGYQSKTTFNSQFQKIMGQSPSSWRKQCTDL